MMEQSKHSPLPWWTSDAGLTIFDEDSTVIAYVSHHWQEGSRAANAHFIIRACNTHDDLLAACEAAVKAWNYSGSQVTQYAMLDKAFELIRAAIAKATEGEQ